MVCHGRSRSAQNPRRLSSRRQIGFQHLRFDADDKGCRCIVDDDAPTMASCIVATKDWDSPADAPELLDSAYLAQVLTDVMRANQEDRSTRREKRRQQRQQRQHAEVPASQFKLQL
eukprot:TRINITY_DN5789_c0_g1_i3.p2 TRINITY_DN5789_c0_g1~~TRINITY_DN5789_c0_g1_i3.p2  ORF type:complete len:116 (-),score=14.51 TRINITY_DN5789_c0_g1_i3:257-604(-)